MILHREPPLSPPPPTCYCEDDCIHACPECGGRMGHEDDRRPVTYDNGVTGPCLADHTCPCEYSCDCDPETDAAYADADEAYAGWICDEWQVPA